MKLCEFVRVPRISDLAKFVVQILKDEALTPLLTVGLLFKFSCIYGMPISQLRNFTSLKLHQTLNTGHHWK